MSNETEHSSDAEIVERLQRLKRQMVPKNSNGSATSVAWRYNPYRIGAAIAIVVLFGVAIWIAYGSVSAVDETVPPPIIRADTSPTKVPPDEPGGLEVADQDMLIFDRLKEGQVEYEEQLLPPAEEPLDIRSNIPPSGSLADAGEATEEIPATPMTEVPVGETSAVVEEAPVPRLPPPPTARLPEAEAGGAYAVQLAALGSYEAAEAAWDIYVKQLPGLLARQSHYVSLLERPGMPTLYRLRTGAYSGRQDADLFCSTLKRQGQDCMVVPR